MLFDVTAGGLTGHTFLVVDANHDGVYTGGSDYVVELVGATGGNAALTIDDFL